MEVTERTESLHLGKRSRDVVENIERIHFPGASFADVTWGKGAFWGYGPLRDRVVGLDRAARYGCQIAADCRAIPLRDGAVDVAVFDPPHQLAPSKTTTLRQ